MPDTKPFYLAVRGILVDENNRCLMLKRSAQSKSQPSLWEFPGGKVDAGEDFATALVREFFEETGLTVTLKSVLSSGEWEREDYKIAYLFMRVERISGEVSISREHDAFVWMDKETLSQAQVTPQLIPLRNLVCTKL